MTVVARSFSAAGSDLEEGFVVVFLEGFVNDSSVCLNPGVGCERGDADDTNGPNRAATTDSAEEHDGDRTDQAGGATSASRASGEYLIADEFCLLVACSSSATSYCRKHTAKPFRAQMPEPTGSSTAADITGRWKTPMCCGSSGRMRLIAVPSGGSPRRWRRHPRMPYPRRSRSS